MFNWKEIQMLKSLGYRVLEFSVYHYRVDNRFDVFPNDRGRPWAWHDHVTNLRGVKPAEQIGPFLRNFLLANPSLTYRPGFLTCLACGAEIPDDGSALAARRMRDHLEGGCDATQASH
jgi:hypothetical protein